MTVGQFIFLGAAYWAATTGITWLGAVGAANGPEDYLPLRKAAWLGPLWVAVCFVAVVALFAALYGLAALYKSLG